MEFSMKLQPLPFSMIESGRKTIELRLYDEKRRLIAIGDTIRFLDISNPEKASSRRLKNRLSLVLLENSTEHFHLPNVDILPIT